MLYHNMNEQQSVQNMLNYIKTKPELVKFVREFNDPMGFLFSKSPYVAEIDYAVDSDGHSGSSFSWCMRQCQAILVKKHNALPAQ